jgi:hypothetical protein
MPSSATFVRFGARRDPSRWGLEAAVTAVERRARREQAVAEGAYERLLDPSADAASDRLWWVLALVALGSLVIAPFAG